MADSLNSSVLVQKKTFNSILPSSTQETASTSATIASTLASSILLPLTAHDKAPVRSRVDCCTKPFLVQPAAASSTTIYPLTLDLDFDDLNTKPNLSTPHHLTTPFLNHTGPIAIKNRPSTEHTPLTTWLYETSKENLPFSEWPERKEREKKRLEKL